MHSTSIKTNLKKIDSLDEEELIGLIRDIGRERYLEALPVLANMLLEATGGVRETIIDTFKEIGGEESVAVLVKLIYHSNFTARNDAMEIMSEIGEPGIPILIPYLKDESEEIRKFIVDMFGVMETPLALDPLLTLKNDPNVNVRSAVAESIGKIGDPRGVETLLELLDADAWTRTYVIEALASFEDPDIAPKILPFTEESNPMIALSSLKTLGSVGDGETVVELLKKLGKRDDFIDSYIILAVGKIVERLDIELTVEDHPELSENVSTILDNLENEEADISDMAALLLARIHSPAAIKSIVRFAMNHEEIPYAVEDILSTPDETAVDVILEEIDLLTAKNIEFFIKCLGNSGSKKALPFLYKCLDSEEEEIRMAAISALGTIGDNESIPYIIRMLSDPVGHVRRTASKFLGEMQSKEAIPELFKVVSDMYEDVRMEAARALVNIGGEDTMNRLAEKLRDENDAPRVAGAFALSIADNIEKYEENLIEVLNDSNWKVRKYAVTALGKIRTDKVTENLILSLSDENNEVKMKVINMLCESENSTVCDAVIPLLSDGDVWVRYEAARSLRKIKTDEVADALVSCLQDESPVVQVAALESLGEFGGEKAAAAAESMLYAEDFEVQDTAQMILDKLLSEEGISI